MLTSCLKGALSRTAWRSTWVELCITETDISFKKVRAHSSPGNDINTSKDATNHDTKVRTELQDPTKAGATEHLDSRRPKPPNLNGKVVCVQLLSEKPQHSILLRHSCNLWSKREGKEPKEKDDTQCKRWVTLRQLLSRCNSTSTLSRSISLSWIATILSNWTVKRIHKTVEVPK